MPVVSRYCSICNKLITAREIESGEAVVYQTYYYCSKCKKEAMPIIEAIRTQSEKEEEQAAKQEKAKSDTARLRIKHRPSTKSPHKQRKSRTGMFRVPRSSPGVRKRERPEHRARPGAAHARPTAKPARPSKEPAEPKPPTHQPPPEEAAPFEMEAVGIESAPAPEPQEPARQAAQPQPVEAQAGERAAELEVPELEPPEVQPAGVEPAQMTAGPAEVEPAEVELAKVEVTAAEPVEMEAVEIEAIEIEVVEHAPAAPAAVGEEAPPRPRPPGAPPGKAPVKARLSRPKVRKHPHLERRRSALHPPTRKKKSWLLVVVFLLVALGVGAIVVYKQFFMPPQEELTPHAKKDDKPRYVDAEKKIGELVALAGKIADRPQDYEDFLRRAAELSQSVLPEELRKKLDDAKKEARQKFDSAAKKASQETRGQYESAVRAGDLKEALKVLESFPAVFKDTQFAKKEIPNLISPVKKTLEVLEGFHDRKAQALMLEQEGNFEQAAELIEKITCNPEEVLPEFLKQIAPEAARLRRLADQKKERLAQAERKRRAAFGEARRAAVELAENGLFTEAIAQLNSFHTQYPDSEYESEIMALIEGFVEKKQRAALMNFFNRKDLHDWMVQGGWKVTDNMIVGSSGDEKTWLLKGDTSWTDYKFEFDFSRKKGSLVLCLRAGPGEPESGFTTRFPQRPFRENTWYHVTCVVTGDKVYITTSFNNQTMVFTLAQASGILGFLLPPGSEVQIKNVSLDMP